MIIGKTNPSGIDRVIDSLQKDLYGQLCDAWKLGEDDYLCYSRAYINQNGSGFVPEVYTGGTEYKEVMIDDTKAAVSFFVTGPRAVIDNSIHANVSLIFHMNIEQVNKNLPHRADEEVRNDVYRIITECGYGFQAKELVTGLKNVYAEFNGVRLDNMKYSDMHPFHCFRYNMILAYNIC